MCGEIDKEVIAASMRGELNYAALLQDMDLVRKSKAGVVHVDNLSENQKQGYNNLERRIRGTH